MFLVKKRIEAYFTVEASFIVPMAIGTIVFVIYAAFYLYGRCVLSQDTYILCFRASKITEDMHTTAEKYITDKSAEQLDKHYFGNKRPVFQTEQNGKTIVLTSKGSSRHRAMGNYFIMPDSNWNYEAKSKATIMDPPKDMRLKKRVVDIYKEIRN